MDTASLFNDVRGEIADARDLVDGFDDAPFNTIGQRLDKLATALGRIGKYVEEIEHNTARPATATVRAGSLRQRGEHYPTFEAAE